MERCVLIAALPQERASSLWKQPPVPPVLFYEWAMPFSVSGSVFCEWKRQEKWCIAEASPPCPYQEIITAKDLWPHLGDSEQQWFLELLVGWCASCGVYRISNAQDFQHWAALVSLELQNADHYPPPFDGQTVQLTEQAQSFADAWGKMIYTKREVLPLSPGAPLRFDNPYERRGTCSLRHLLFVPCL